MQFYTVNKIAGAVLGTAMAVLAIYIVSEEIYGTDAPEEHGAVVQPATTPRTAATIPGAPAGPGGEQVAQAPATPATPPAGGPPPEAPAAGGGDFAALAAVTLFRVHECRHSFLPDRKAIYSNCENSVLRT